MSAMDMSENPMLTAECVPDYLWRWLEWISNDTGVIRKELWFPASTPTLCGGWARGDNYWEDQQTEMDSYIAVVVDRAIQDLPPGYQAAIYWVTGVQKVAKPNRVEDRFVEALALLEKKIIARNVVVSNGK